MKILVVKRQDPAERFAGTWDEAGSGTVELSTEGGGAADSEVPHGRTE